MVWAALLAASIPHELNLPLLAELSETTVSAAERMVETLRKLSCITICSGRAAETFKVDPAVRLPLREHLRIWHPDRWQRHSGKACTHFKRRHDSSSRIEALYHLFALNQTSAAWHCQALSDYFRDAELNKDQDALTEALTELILANWLAGPARVEAILSILWHRASRGGTRRLKRETQKVLELALETAHPSRLADAWILMGDVHLTKASPSLALAAYQNATAILNQLISPDTRQPAWHRALAIAHARTGLAHQHLDSPLAALVSLEKSRILMENLCARYSADPVTLRELETIRTRCLAAFRAASGSA